jgi:putative peptidoglycan binding protein
VQFLQASPLFAITLIAIFTYFFDAPAPGTPEYFQEQAVLRQERRAIQEQNRRETVQVMQELANSNHSNMWTIRNYLALPTASNRTPASIAYYSSTRCLVFTLVQPSSAPSNAYVQVQTESMPNGLVVVRAYSSLSESIRLTYRFYQRRVCPSETNAYAFTRPQELPRTPSSSESTTTAGAATNAAIARQEPRSRIMTIQRYLATQGLSPGSIDGILGPQTQQAIRRWQTLVSYPVTGVISDSQYEDIVRYLQLHP